MWDLVDEEIGIKREQELCAGGIWKSMIDRGASVKRFRRTESSAFDVLAPIFEKIKQREAILLKEVLNNLATMLKKKKGGQRLFKEIEDLAVLRYQKLACIRGEIRTQTRLQSEFLMEEFENACLVMRRLMSEAQRVGRDIHKLIDTKGHIFQNIFEKENFSTRVGVRSGRFSNILDDRDSAVGLSLLTEFAAPRAIHNPKDHYDPPKCHPETQLKIMDQLMDWITGKTSRNARLLWFHGPTGAGKSAIAQSLVEICDKQKLLLASFFFSRTDPTRNAINPLASTIAHQIVNSFPPVAELIKSAVDKRLFTELFETQFIKLVIQPLAEFRDEAAANSFPCLIIIDGLNECFDSDTQAQIVKSLAKILLSDAKELPLRFLVISRPDPHLQQAFDSIVPSYILYRLTLVTPDEDIRIFLENQFAKIKDKNPAISSSWPTFDIIDNLVRRSSGTFVFAWTVVKYVSASNDPIACLDAILQLHNEEGTPLARLDAVYSHILSSVKDSRTIRLILGAILFVNPNYNLFAPLSSTKISASQTLSGVDSLLGLKPSEAENSLANLYPMIQLSPDGNIVIPHATVAEFLNDCARSKSFHIDKSLILPILTDCCFKSLKTNNDHTLNRFAYGHIPQLCMNIPFTTDLLRNLEQFSLSRSHRWLQDNARPIGGALRKKRLFAWWYVTKFMCVLRQLEATGAYLNHLSVFDQLVASSFARYPSTTDAHLLVVLATIPSWVLMFTQTRITDFLTNLGISSCVFNVDSSSRGLGILSIFPEEHTFDRDCLRVGRHWDQDIVMDVYYQYLHGFFLDDTRSKAYFLSPEVYSAVVLKVLGFISPPQQLPNATNSTQTNGDLELLMILLVHLLAKSSKSEELLRLLRSSEFKLFLAHSNGQVEVEDIKRSIVEYEHAFN